MQSLGRGPLVFGSFGISHIPPRTDRRWPSWGRCLVCLLAVCLLGAEPPAKPGPGGGDPGIQLAADFIKAFEEQTRLAAESSFLKAEAKLLSSDQDHNGNPRPATAVLKGLLGLRPELQKLALSLLEEHADPLNEQIKKLADESEIRIEPLREACLATRGELNSGRMKLFEMAAMRQFSGQFASLINVDNRWLWFFGVLSVGTLLAVRVHHYRNYYRRLSWVRKRRAVMIGVGLMGCLGLVLVPTLLTFLLGNKTYESLISLTQKGGSPKSRFEKEVADLQSEIAELRQKQEALLKEREDALAKRNSRITTALAAGGENRVAVLELSKSLRDHLLQLTVNSQVEAALAAELGRELPELDKLQGDLQQHAAGIQSYQWIKRLTGAGLGLGLLGCTLWFGLLLERRISRERKLLSNTCPRCTAWGKLEPNPNQQSPGGVVAPALRELICTNVISEDPYEDCQFVFLEQHREHPRLTFPTLGVPSCGKTVGMLMTYHLLRNAGCYGTGTFEKLSTAGSKEFDQKVDDLINRGIVPERTILGVLPPPVVFNFSDNDSLLGRSNVLVNIFDYSGEITSNRRLTDAHRYRALNGDGYFFYLDPTYPSQDQSDALNRFREDIKTLRRLGPNQQVHTPVALCLTKIDLMVTQPYGRGDTILEFYDDLRKIEQTTANGSLERITKRSELTSRLRHLIWPDWEIEAQIRGLFGDRFMFFPMTPIGMDQPGEENLAVRHIRPYCILEPVSWLLHMNGYPVLKE